MYIFTAATEPQTQSHRVLSSLFRFTTIQQVEFIMTTSLIRAVLSGYTYHLFCVIQWTTISGLVRRSLAFSVASMIYLRRSDLFIMLLFAFRYVFTIASYLIGVFVFATIVGEWMKVFKNVDVNLQKNKVLTLIMLQSFTTITKIFSIKRIIWKSTVLKNVTFQFLTR